MTNYDPFIAVYAHIMVTAQCRAKENEHTKQNVLKRNIFIQHMSLHSKRNNSRPNKLCHLYHTLRYFFLKHDNRPLLFGVEKNIPYKGLHLSLAIIPEEYNIIIYCHTK